MSSVAELLTVTGRQLADCGIPEPRREAASLLCAALVKERSFLYAHPEYMPSPDELARFQQMVERRASHEPFHYIAGTKEFYGLEFEVSPAVLIPRPETELLVELGIRALADARVPEFCEVGVGSGCISIALLVNVHKAKAVGLEISDDAIAVAKRNAAKLAVGRRFDIRGSDVFSALDDGEKFDLLVSNPPYIPASDIPGLDADVREFEPHLALTDGGDGLSIIRRLVGDAPCYLKPRGRLMFEIGMGQAGDVIAVFDQSIWAEVQAYNDFQGIARVIHARLRDR